MNARHPTEEQIALFVMRAFDQITFEGIEGHLDRCDTCAEQLAAQAELELTMQTLADATSWCPRCGVAAEATCVRCGVALRPGGYTIEAVLSEYGQGRTYRGRAPDGALVRISELEFSHVRDQSVVESFVKEATLLAQLDHPNIPKLVDSFQEGDDEHLRLYAVETWVDGESLDVILEQHRFDESEARHIAEQVLGVLVYLQGLSPQIYHRDIRPQNLLYAEDGTVFVRQFASARDMSVTGAFTLAGHTGYIPAEQHLGVVDATSDLYGLGATLAHLLTRRAPLPGEPGLERANVSPAFEAWLKRLMAMRPQGRFASAVAARAALFEPAREKRGALVRPTLVLAACGVLVASVALAVSYMISNSTPPLPPRPPAPNAAEYGVLQLDSTPSGARITLDGAVMGANAPADVHQLAYGQTYTVRLELDGHAPFETTVTMAAETDGDIVRHRFVPNASPPAPKPQQPPKRAAPPPKEPPVDQVEATRKTPLADLLADAPPKRPLGDDVPKQSPGCRIDPDAAPGYITVSTTPYSDLFWGDRRLGQTPLARVQLPAGCIEIRAVAVDGKAERKVRIKILPSEVSIYRFDVE